MQTPALPPPTPPPPHRTRHDVSVRTRMWCRVRVRAGVHTRLPNDCMHCNVCRREACQGKGWHVVTDWLRALQSCHACVCLVWRTHDDRSHEEDPRFRHLPHSTWVLDLRTHATEEFPFVRLLLGDSAATSPTDADLEHGFTASTVDQTTTVCCPSTGKTLVARTQSRDWENWVLRHSAKDPNAPIKAIGLSPGDTAKLKEMTKSFKRNDSLRVWRAQNGVPRVTPVPG